MQGLPVFESGEGRLQTSNMVVPTGFQNVPPCMNPRKVGEGKRKIEKRDMHCKQRGHFI